MDSPMRKANVRRMFPENEFPERSGHLAQHEGGVQVDVPAQQIFRRLLVGVFPSQVGSDHAEFRNRFLDRGEAFRCPMHRIGKPPVHPGVEENEHARLRQLS
jgi:hypothetical protein